MKKIFVFLTIFFEFAVFAATENAKLSGTKLSVPQRTGSEGIFFVRDPAIPANVRIASSKSLRGVVSSLRKTADDGQFPDEKRLLFVAQNMLDIAYSRNSAASAKFKSLESDDVWNDIISSARMGIFYSGASREDFFSLVLPSLAMFFAPDVSPFFEKSLASLEKAREKFPQSVLVQFMLGVLHEKNDFPRLATQYYRAAFDGDKSCEKTAVALANNLVATGATDAGDFCKSLLNTGFSEEIFPIYVQNCLNLGMIDEAERAVADGLAQNSLNSGLHLAKAQVFMRRNDLKSASNEIAIFERNAKKNEKFFFVRTEFLVQNGAISQAAANANSALKAFPHNLNLLLQAAKLAVKNDVKIAELHNYQKLQDKTQDEIAKAIAEQALQKDEKNLSALEVMAIFSQKHSAQKDALDFSTRFLQIAQNLDMQIIRIKALLALGKSSEAHQEAESLFEREGENENVRDVYVRALVATRQTEKCREAISGFLPTASQSGKSNLFYLRSQIAANDDERISDLRSSLVANPRNSDCLFALYRFYYARNDFRNAQHYLRQLVVLNPNNSNFQRLQKELQIRLAK